MPLYCCDVCGWATASFRVEAVREHQFDCPGCIGTMRITFADLPGIADARLPPEASADADRVLNASLRLRADQRGRRFRIERARWVAPTRRGS